METTFYDDQTYSSKDSINNLKKTMTLDLNSARPPKKAKFSLLSSPDLNMLKLASPELENLIIQQNGVVTTTPTPTQFIFPRNVTEEQEMYARGFVDALAELHTGLTDAPNAPTTNSSVTTTASFTTLTANNTITSTIPMPPLSNAPVSLAPVTSTSAYPTTTTSSSAFLNVPIKEEPQTVPNLGATPPLSPIDMENQERIKLERKRQRNRIAASKCRRRKLERIARLEDKVRLLKNENTELGNIVNQLREQVCQLKQQVMDHVSNGCQIMISSPF